MDQSIRRSIAALSECPPDQLRTFATEEFFRRIRIAVVRLCESGSREIKYNAYGTNVEAPARRMIAKEMGMTCESFEQFMLEHPEPKLYKIIREIKRAKKSGKLSEFKAAIGFDTQIIQNIQNPVLPAEPRSDTESRPEFDCSLLEQQRLLVQNFFKTLTHQKIFHLHFRRGRCVSDERMPSDATVRFISRNVPDIAPIGLQSEFMIAEVMDEFRAAILLSLVNNGRADAEIAGYLEIKDCATVHRSLGRYGIERKTLDADLESPLDSITPTPAVLPTLKTRLNGLVHLTGEVAETAGNEIRQAIRDILREVNPIALLNEQRHITPEAIQALAKKLEIDSQEVRRLIHLLRTSLNTCFSVLVSEIERELRGDSAQTMDTTPNDTLPNPQIPELLAATIVPESVPDSSALSSTTSSAHHILRAHFADLVMNRPQDIFTLHFAAGFTDAIGKNHLASKAAWETIQREVPQLDGIQFDLEMAAFVGRLVYESRAAAIIRLGSERYGISLNELRENAAASRPLPVQLQSPELTPDAPETIAVASSTISAASAPSSAPGIADSVIPSEKIANESHVEPDSGLCRQNETPVQLSAVSPGIGSGIVSIPNSPVVLGAARTPVDITHQLLRDTLGKIPLTNYGSDLLLSRVQLNGTTRYFPTELLRTLLSERLQFPILPTDLDQFVFSETRSLHSIVRDTLKRQTAPLHSIRRETIPAAAQNPTPLTKKPAPLREVSTHTPVEFSPFDKPFSGNPNNNNMATSPEVYAKLTRQAFEEAIQVLGDRPLHLFSSDGHMPDIVARTLLADKLSRQLGLSVTPNDIRNVVLNNRVDVYSIYRRTCSADNVAGTRQRGIQITLSRDFARLLPAGHPKRIHTESSSAQKPIDTVISPILVEIAAPATIVTEPNVGVERTDATATSSNPAPKNHSPKNPFHQDHASIERPDIPSVVMDEALLAKVRGWVFDEKRNPMDMHLYGTNNSGARPMLETQKQIAADLETGPFPPEVLDRIGEWIYKRRAKTITELVRAGHNNSKIATLLKTSPMRMSEAIQHLKIDVAKIRVPIVQDEIKSPGAAGRSHLVRVGKSSPAKFARPAISSLTENEGNNAKNDSSDFEEATDAAIDRFVDRILEKVRTIKSGHDLLHHWFIGSYRAPSRLFRAFLKGSVFPQEDPDDVDLMLDETPDLFESVRKIILEKAGRSPVQIIQSNYSTDKTDIGSENAQDTPATDSTTLSEDLIFDAVGLFHLTPAILNEWFDAEHKPTDLLIGDLHRMLPWIEESSIREFVSNRVIDTYAIVESLVFAQNRPAPEQESTGPLEEGITRSPTKTFGSQSAADRYYALYEPVADDSDATSTKEGQDQV